MIALAASTCAGVAGERRRIANFDSSVGDNCPTGWSKFLQHIDHQATMLHGCYSTAFSSKMSYNRVCGMIRRYQNGSPDRPESIML